MVSLLERILIELKWLKDIFIGLVSINGSRYLEFMFVKENLKDVKLHLLIIYNQYFEFFVLNLLNLWK